MLESVGLILAGFIGTELVSIPLHRYIFHGLLWDIHKSHHSPRHGPFEHNDLFSLFFATLSIALMAMGVFWPGMGSCLFIGLGICLYGGVYFVVHDLMAHKRYYPVRPTNPVLKGLVRAHRRHHQRVDQQGQGPWGLFIYRYDLHHAAPKSVRRLGVAGAKLSSK